VVDVPANVLVRERAPVLELLPQVDVVVCHGGHNTVCEALWHGVPLVVAPIRDDQPIVARQVTDSGAGERVRFARVTPDRLAAVIRSVLTDPAHRTAAQGIGAGFREAGGVPAAATACESLLVTSPR
jgi:MGT family glycosyltransferase